jgi:lipid II:glycine glycyltransferase (peptidoglycan interpeptide bridge formation enzyme)
MRIFHQLEHKTWRKFVDDHPQGNIFHTIEMFEVFERTKGHQPTLWAAVEGSDQVLALMVPVKILQNSRLPSSLSRCIVHGGVLYDHSPEGREGLSLLLDQYKKETRGSNLYTELRNHTDTKGIQPVLENKDFTYEEHLNYLINLKCKPDDVLKAIGKRTRKHIRRGLRKQNFNIQVAKQPDQVSECYELIKKTYQNVSIPIAHKSLFEAVFEILHPKAMVQFLLAKVEGVSVAASVELLYKDVIYGWYSGMDRAYSSYTPNELIMWHILSWGAENNYQTYDFGGAGTPDEDYGVRVFKSKFGGSLVNFGRNKYVPFPWFYKFAEFGYRVSKRFLFS